MKKLGTYIVFEFLYLQFLSEILFSPRSRVIVGFNFDFAERTKLSIISSSADIRSLLNNILYS